MTTWILLRGLTREAGHWGAFLSQLRAVLPADDLLLTPDLPGNGRLHANESPASVEEMVASCRQALRDEGHQPPYKVLAMSLGTMVTVAWAHQHPHELAGCVLINTSLRPFSRFWQRLRPRQYPVIFKLLLGSPDAAQWEEAIMRMTTRHPPDRERTLSAWMTLRTAHPVATRNGLRQLLAAIRYRAPLSCPDVPILLLNGLGDELVHPDCSAEVARRWGVPLIRHPTAGHDLPLDAALWVARQVHAWQAALPSSARPRPGSQPPHR
jgi:pimeloyl-ACP methyl ester carboxylesterase